MPSLFVVATPIGNLEDITLRALRVLREVSVIAAEDTRKTRILLNKYDINTPLTSYHEHNKLARLDRIMERLNEADVALVCNAGTPAISDPGYELVVAAHERGIPVVAVPGPSIAAAAMSVAGLPTDRFTFTGYLPARAAARKRLLESIAGEQGSVITLETPHRLTAALQDMQAVLGVRRIAVCRELTKIHEEVFRGTPQEALEYFTGPKGEFTIIIEGVGKKERPAPEPQAEKQLKTLRDEGVKAKEAVSAVSGETGIPRKELYQAWLRLNKSGKKKAVKAQGGAG